MAIWNDRKSPDFVQVRAVRHPLTRTTILIIKLLLLSTTIRHVLIEGSDRYD